MSVDVLKEICKEKKIKNIALVDDVFDTPTIEDLDPICYSDFRQRYNGDQDFKNAVTRVSGTKILSLPRFEKLGEEELDPFWKSTWKPQCGGQRLKGEFAQALRDLFQAHAHDVLGMLDTVVRLRSLFCDELNISVTVHGTGFDANDVAKADIVVIDYFLGHNLTHEEARELALTAVKEVVDAARKARRIPSFLLVSSRPQDIEFETFRESAKLMKSRFRFFAKDNLPPHRVSDMVNLHDLIDASDRTEIVEQLIEDWKKGASSAIDAVHELMLGLDISDLVYLDCLRLAHEGTSINNYLRWFLTASLNAGVTDKLTKKLWNDAATLKLFDVVDDGGHLDTKTLAKTFDGPSDAIARAYGNILFDNTRGTGDYAFQLPTHDLDEGDLFVRPKGKDRKGYENAEVRLIITPSCDLRRASGCSNKPRSVLLLPGTLKAVIQEDKQNNLANADFVFVQERGNWRLLRIEWEFLCPISIDWNEMAASGLGRKFRRLGQVRDLYLHKVRDEFANRLTRIGPEVAPLLPHSRSGEVFIKVMNKGIKNYKSVMCFSSTDEFIWEIGPVVVKGSSGEKHVYQTSRNFIDELTDKLSRLPKGNSNLADSVAKSIEHLQNMQTYMALLRPMALGIRGEGEGVEIKKAVKRSNKNFESQAGLLIRTFID